MIHIHSVILMGTISVPVYACTLSRQSELCGQMSTDLYFHACSISANLWKNLCRLEWSGVCWNDVNPPYTISLYCYAIVCPNLSNCPSLSSGVFSRCMFSHLETLPEKSYGCHAKFQPAQGLPYGLPLLASVLQPWYSLEVSHPDISQDWPCLASKIWWDWVSLRPCKIESSFSSHY